MLSLFNFFTQNGKSFFATLEPKDPLDICFNEEEQEDWFYLTDPEDVMEEEEEKEEKNERTKNGKRAKRNNRNHRSI